MIADDIARIVREVMSDDPVHGWPHVERVRAIALEIAKSYEGVDVEALEVAALLHDIARNGVRSGDHALRSAEVARRILELAGWPEERIDKVVDAILAHSYSAGREPTTLEGEILSDADKIDALGAIGVARALMYGGAIGRGLEETLEHMRSKLLRLPSLMRTEVGKKIAEERVKYVELFIKQLEAELAWLRERGKRSSDI